MTRNQLRRTWLRLHSRYQKRGLAIFRRKLRQAATIPFDNITENTYRASVVLNVNTDEVLEALEELYLFVGLSHGNRVGKAINRELNQEKDFNPDRFPEEYRRALSQWLINNAGEKINGITEELREYIIKFIADRLEDGTDIRTIARQLEKHVLSERSFYRWQIERIVRTETTAAANFGAIQAGNSARIVWEKEWISSRDGRTRRRPEDQFDHFDMDGVRVPKGEKFSVQGDLLDHPGDPTGHPANVINCRCAVAIVPKRDRNGKIIRTVDSRLINI